MVGFSHILFCSSSFRIPSVFQCLTLEAMYLVSDLIVVKFTESFLSASWSSPVAVQFPVAHLQSKLRCLRTSYLICTILLTFQLRKSANFRYTDPGSTIGQTQDGDFETYLNLQKGGWWNQTFYPLVKQNAFGY